MSQDVLADADIVVHGTGPAVTYLLQCLALVGFATRHGHIRLCMADREVTETDLANQFLLRPDTLEESLADCLVDAVNRIDPAIAISVVEGEQAPRGLAVAVPGADELAALRDRSDIVVWGQVLPSALYVGPAPVQMPSDEATILTAALAAACGGLLVQVVLGQLGAVVEGPAVLSRWFEEQFWVRHPKIGVHARAAIRPEAPWPALAGVLERAGVAVLPEGLRFLTEAGPVQPWVNLVVDDDAVVVTVPVEASNAPPSTVTVRPGLMTPPPVRSVVWSPIAGAALDGDQVRGADRLVSLPATGQRILLCGVGALGSWASAVIAASHLPSVEILVVDMDDAVETTNLNRQVLFGTGDVGRPKATRAVERLSEIDPALGLQALSIMVDPDLIGELTGEEVVHLIEEGLFLDERRTRQKQVATLTGFLRTAAAILSCPDNHQTRWSLNVIAERLGVPLVNGAVDGLVGRVHVCDPGGHDRCLVCWLGTRIAQDPVRRSCTDVVTTAPVPSIVTSAAVVGSAQSALLIAQLAGLGPELARFHIFEGAEGRLEGHRAADRDPEECPAHLEGPGTPLHPVAEELYT